MLLLNLFTLIFSSLFNKENHCCNYPYDYNSDNRKQYQCFHFLPPIYSQLVLVIICMLNAPVSVFTSRISQVFKYTAQITEYAKPHPSSFSINYSVKNISNYKIYWHSKNKPHMEYFCHNKRAYTYH